MCVQLLLVNDQVLKVGVVGKRFRQEEPCKENPKSLYILAKYKRMCQSFVTQRTQHEHPGNETPERKRLMRGRPG